VKTRVVLLTGYLGSGKTTLLSRLLVHPEMGETAVIVNELGEVAIDHHLLRRVDERTVVLGNGCVCCTLRGDLADELRDLLSRRDRGEIPAFRRVVVETTGLADPSPILYTLLGEPVVKHHFELERVITTVDAQHGLRSEESVKQAAVADRLVVTKPDLADPAMVMRELRRLNPAAEILESVLGDLAPGELFDGDERDPRDLVFDEAPLEGRLANIEAWKGYASSFPRYVIYPHQLVSDGTHIVVLGHTTGSHLHLPDEQESALTLLWRATVSDGQLARWQLLEDTPQRRAEFGLSVDA